LDIVGMYLNMTFDVPLVDGFASVEDVLDAAVSTLDADNGSISLRYTSEGRTLDAFTVTHRTPPKSRSGREYPVGTYTFSDPQFKANPNGIPVWQYYVFDENGVPQSIEENEEDFTPFRDARFKFQDGWTVKWRCVLIFSFPARPIPLKLASK
ncbi:MAG: hypothetical protein AAF512_26270, partial [Pseudomonadota bacterium]